MKKNLVLFAIVFSLLGLRASADNILCQGNLAKDKLAGDVCVALAISQGQLNGYSNITCVNKVQECAVEGGTGVTACYDQQCYIGNTKIGAAGYLVGWEGHAAPGWWQVPNILNRNSSSGNTNSTNNNSTNTTTSSQTTSTSNATNIVQKATNITTSVSNTQSQTAYMNTMLGILRSMVENAKATLAAINSGSTINVKPAPVQTPGNSGTQNPTNTPNTTKGYPFTGEPAVSLSLNSGTMNGLLSANINSNDHNGDLLVLNWSSKNIDSATFTTDLEVTRSLTSSSGVQRECVPLFSYLGYPSVSNMFTDKRGSLPFENTLFAGKRFLAGDPCNWGKTKFIKYVGYQYNSGKQDMATIYITTNKVDDVWFSYGAYGGYSFTNSSPNFYGANTWGFENGGLYFGQNEDTNGNLLHSAILNNVNPPFTFSNMPVGMTASASIGADESMGGSSKVIANRFSIRLNTAGVKPDYYVIRIKPNKTGATGYLDLPVIVPVSNPSPLDKGPGL